MSPSFATPPEPGPRDATRRKARPRERRAPAQAQHRLFDQIPALGRRVGRRLRELAPENALLSVWVGPKASFTPPHYDPVDNVVAQLLGRKRWRLWRPRRDADAPDGDPDFDFVLAPGALLFVPKAWWHAVTSLDPAVSVSVWFDDDVPPGAPLAPLTRDRQPGA